jgi:tetratricopeptide (TPR) repeat protein
MLTMSRCARSLIAVLAAVAVLHAPLARAEDVKDSKVAAKEHFQRGTSYYDLGRYADAIKEFEAAYELKNDPAFLYNLAQSYRLAGDADQALHFYRTYLRYVPKPANRAEIDERIKALEQQLAQKGTGTTQPPGPSVTVTSPPPQGGITPPPVTPVTPVVPGTPGPTTPPYVPPPTAPPPTYGSAPPPVVGAPASSPSTEQARGRKLQIAGMATAGGGGLLFLIGIVEGLRARSASNDINAAAAKGLAYDPDVQSRGQSAETAQKWLLTLGVLAGAGGAALWYYGRRVSAAAETTSYRISFGPALSTNGGGAWLRVGF